MNQADEAWVKALYERNAPKMYHIALHRLGDEEEAKNIVQEAFCTLLEKVDLVRMHPNPAGWLMKTLQFLILQSIGTDKHRAEHEVPIREGLRIRDKTRHDFSLRDTLPPGLTQRERDLFVWFYEERLTYEEIAQRLRIPILTCRTQMFRAKRHYKKLAESENDLTELM